MDAAMDGKEFLQVAQDCSNRANESYWRTGASRAYYAAMIEILDAFTRWGLSKQPSGSVHQSVRQRLYTSRDTDMKLIGRLIDYLRDLRKLADYEMATQPYFASNHEAATAVQRSTDAISLFSAIDADPVRRNAIQAEIQRVLP
jgi:hypothetical protein